MVQSRRYIKPSSFAQGLNNALARLGAPAVAIPGRVTGKLRRTAVIPIKVDGKLYVVSTRGDSDWVRNLRTARSGELRKGWSATKFTALEVTGNEQERVIDAYKRKVGAEVRRYFDQLPAAEDHPVFRLKS